MRKIYNYIMIAVFSFAAVSCIDEIGNTDIPTAETGDEVQFGLSLPDAKTRTVYGKEANNAFPIYWVNNDKVQIFSPQGLENRRSAEYQVSVTEANQNYADNLNKTGAYGVQWGEEYIITEDGEKKSNLHNFYSLYPSGNYTLSSDGSKAENITINYSQNIVVDGNSVKSDMEDCLMYAKAEGVVRGNTVHLKYTPISTVFMITLNVPENSADDFLIQSISLTAPATTKIAGTFSLNIADGTFGGWGSRSESTVSAQLSDKTTGGLYTLVKGNSVEIPLFIAPVKDLNTTGWKISVVANNKTYSKTLGDQKIVAGKIHKVTLPSLSTAEVEEWNVADWMKNIPRNVYLSEVSIPGTWNSMNSDSQNNTSLTDQYAKGARAFHIDTRWKRTNEGSTWQPSYKYELGVAIGGEGNTTSGNNKYMTAGSTFVEALTEITGNLKSDEYMVLICTFAQNSAQYNGANGWVNAISDACKGNDLVFDAKTLSAETVIGEVLNRLIVIVNMEGAFTSVPSDSKCIFINAPMTIPSLDYFNNDITKESYLATKDTTTPTKSDITFYASHAQISVQGDGSNCGKEDRQDDDRGYIPSYDERRDIALDILKWSKDNYSKESYAHDCWIYLGFGGYYAKWNEGVLGINRGWKDITDAYELIAADFSKLISDEVDKMATEQNGEMVPYYPVGIVLLNNGVDCASTLKKILLLNNKYRLQFDPNKPTDYNPNAKARSAAASYSSGMQDTGTSAFGWE